MKMKKIFALLLALVMMFAMVAACEVDTGDGSGNASSSGGGGGGGGDDANTESGEKSERQLLVESYGLEWEGEPEDITFSIFVGGSGKPPAPGNKIVDLLYQLTGVKIEFEFEVREVETKVGTMVASGDYPDFITGVPANVRNMLIEADSFIPLDDKLPNYPQLWAHYEPYLDILRNVSTDNTIRIMDVWNRYYWMDDGVDSQYLSAYNGPAWWIQKDVIAFNDYVAPTTLEEYFDLIRRYIAVHPEIDGQPTLGYEVYAGAQNNFVMKNPPQHLVGMRNEGDAVVLSRDPFVIEIYDNKDYAKAYYQILNEAYKDGLINPATFTRQSDEYNAVISQGRVLGMFDQQWQFESGEGVLITEGRIERTYVPLGITLPGYESGLWTKPAAISGGNGIGITQSCKDVDRALKFMEQLLTPEIQRLIYWGIEGEDYYVDNGRLRRTADQKANWDNDDWKTENTAVVLGNQFPKIQGRFPDGNAVQPGDQPEEREENALEYDIEFFSHFPFNRKDGFLNIVDDPGFPELWSVRQNLIPKDPDFAAVQKAIEDVGIFYLEDVIKADDFESAWAEYVARYDELDVEQFETKLAAAAAEQGR